MNRFIKVIKNNLRSVRLSLALLLSFTLTASQLKAQDRLNAYIAEGLASNQSIKQQDFLLEKNVFALREAKSLFLPNVSFSTTYARADGGRTIDVPTGDLLNGVYATLNKLTGSPAFPHLENQHVQLNPDNFYDAKFRTSIPILNAELLYNKRIKIQQVDLQQTEVKLYKRELVNDIQSAYYQYAKAVNAVHIYETSLRLVEEGKRINASLFKNEKVNRSAVIRSDNEVARVNASLIGAKKTKESARYYFNFLLNKPLTDSITLEEVSALPAPAVMFSTDVQKREELSKLRLAQGINRNLTSMTRSYLIPKIGTYIDLGSQAFNWDFNRQSRYYFLGVSLQWDFFAAGKNTYRTKQAIADQHGLEAQTDYVWQQLLMALKIKQNELASALARHEAARSQLKTAQTYYDDELKLYKEGLVIYIELLDAQNQLINTKLDTNIALFDIWIAHAGIERANASFDIQ